MHILNNIFTYNYGPYGCIDIGCSESGDLIDVFIKGVGSGRDNAIRSLHSNGLNILSIKDITPIPHNGCKPPKRRRV